MIVELPNGSFVDFDAVTCTTIEPPPPRASTTPANLFFHLTSGGPFPFVTCANPKDAHRIAKTLWDYYQNGLLSDLAEKHVASTGGASDLQDHNDGTRLVVDFDDSKGGRLIVRIEQIRDEEELAKANNSEG